MDNLVNDIASCLASAFYRLLRPKRAMEYRFQHGLDVVSVKVEVLTPKVIELEQEVYVEGLA